MKNFLFLLATLVFPLGSYAQNFTTTQLLEDLDYFHTQLPQKHIDLFHRLSQEDFESRIREIRAEIPRLDEPAFLNRLMQLVAAVGDEHTRLSPKDLNKSRAPIRLGMFREGIFLTGADSCSASLLLSRLVAVNGVPVGEVMERLSTIIPDVNPSYFDVAALSYLSNTSILKGLGIADSKERINYTFLNAKGEEVEAQFEASNVPAAVLADPYSRLTAYAGSGNYWYRYLPQENAVYFNYASCQEDKSLPFQEFNEDLFREIDDRKPGKLIIDLRHNGGGNSHVLEPFLEKIKDSYLNQEGKFFVLIGKNTFSSALLNALDLKDNYQTLLIGEPTAGSINHYGEILPLNLPNTRALVLYSTNYFENQKGAGGSLVPDVRVEYSIENFKKNIDEALEYTRKF